MSGMATASIGWYVHVPFCTTKCGYCDFYSVPTRPGQIFLLTDALRREMEARDPRRPIASVFVGGGTPTVLPREALSALLEPLAARLASQTGGGNEPIEFTCEANPSSADELKLDLLRSRGVNRLSLGAQSFDEGDLRVLERLHDPSHVSSAVTAARRAGFDNLNLDLIFAVPGQTLSSWLESLRRAIEIGPEHIACYSLMYEEGTALTRRLRLGQVQPCDEDLEADLYEAAVDVLRDAGYEQYEISNFARPGRECRHNLLYWRNEEYVGIGPSAVSYLDGERRKNAASVDGYLRAWCAGGTEADGAVVEREALDAPYRARETAVQMLRLTAGIDVRRFAAATGFDPLSLFAEAIERHARGGLLEADGGSIRLTRRGRLLANRVMADFL